MKIKICNWVRKKIRKVRVCNWEKKIKVCNYNVPKVKDHKKRIRVCTWDVKKLVCNWKPTKGYHRIKVCERMKKVLVCGK